MSFILVEIYYIFPFKRDYKHWGHVLTSLAVTAALGPPSLRQKCARPHWAPTACVPGILAPAHTPALAKSYVLSGGKETAADFHLKSRCLVLNGQRKGKLIFLKKHHTYTKTSFTLSVFLLD